MDGFFQLAEATTEDLENLSKLVTRNQILINNYILAFKAGTKGKIDAAVNSIEKHDLDLAFFQHSVGDLRPKLRPEHQEGFLDLVVNVHKLKDAPPEHDYSTVEYKLLLLREDSNKETQMKIRVERGFGITNYVVGIRDNGEMEGLNRTNLKRTIEVLRAMAETLDFEIYKVIYYDTHGKGKKVAEVIIAEPQLRMKVLDSSDFKLRTKQNAQTKVKEELNNLLITAPKNQKEKFGKELIGFQRLYAKFVENDSAKLQWINIQELPETAIRDYGNLEAPENSSIKQKLKKLIVVKLNGGLGTSMGCQGPKSLIAVRNDLTFLDVTCQQIDHLNTTYNAEVPLVLMNSFNTHEDTEKVISKYSHLNVKIFTFKQSRYPRINKESLFPIAKNFSTEADMEAWYPPGHGDFYASFAESGLLDQFLKEGREYCFISNMDNLGATVDLKILNLLSSEPNDRPIEFLMEVTDKTRADVKGGTLIQYEDKLRLVEMAQVPKQHVEDFQSTEIFKNFNTNNLWVRLGSIKRRIDDETLDIEVIVSPKTLANGLNVLQLETAAGAAIRSFESGIGLNVPRSRFLPVKKTEDLLLLMSNFYIFENSCFTVNPLRTLPSTPLIKLGDDHFAKVAEFLRRFETIPDLVNLDQLTVSGNVTFGRNVSLKGAVTIIADDGDRVDIPSCALLENKIVIGSLRFLGD